MIGHLTETILSPALHQVGTVRVDWACGLDGCEGKMVVEVMPPEEAVGSFPHRCSKCDRVETATCAYPRIGHREIERSRFVGMEYVMAAVKK
jgi:hypothetical protein